MKIQLIGMMSMEGDRFVKDLVLETVHRQEGALLRAQDLVTVQSKEDLDRETVAFLKARDRGIVHFQEAHDLETVLTWIDLQMS